MIGPGLPPQAQADADRTSRWSRAYYQRWAARVRAAKEDERQRSGGAIIPDEMINDLSDSEDDLAVHRASMAALRRHAPTPPASPPASPVVSALPNPVMSRIHHQRDTRGNGSVTVRTEVVSRRFENRSSPFYTSSEEEGACTGTLSPRARRRILREQRELWRTAQLTEMKTRSRVNRRGRQGQGIRLISSRSMDGRLASASPELSRHRPRLRKTQSGRVAKRQVHHP